MQIFSLLTGKNVRIHGWMFLFVSLLLATLPLVAQPSKGKPNVILIMTDDQGYGDLSCHGNPVLQTPAIDQLYRQSIRLTDYHATPMCTPTRGQLLTGIDAARNGAVNVSSGRTLLRRTIPTMADFFLANGYQTGLFGKWHLGDNFPYSPDRRGFGESLWFPSSHIGSVPDHWGNDYFDDTYFHNGKPQAMTGYCTDVFFEEAMAWMDKAAKANHPFFTYLSLNAPHAPWFAPGADVQEMEAAIANSQFASLEPKLKNNLVRYLAMIRRVDVNVGRLMHYLQASGIADNTIVLFTTDNGGTFGPDYYNAGMRGKKTELWEGGHRVPFFIRWPDGRLRQPGDVDGLTQSQDVLPTLIELCQLKTAAGTRFDGTSLAKVLRGQQEVTSDRSLVINYSRMPSGFDYPSPVSPSLMRREGAVVLWKRWRLISGNQLYDLATDPLQRTNVAAKFPAILATLNVRSLFPVL